MWHFYAMSTSPTSITEEIGDLRVTIRKLRPIKSAKGLAYLLRIVGPQAAEVLTRGGLPIGEGKVLTLRELAMAALAEGEASDLLKEAAGGFMVQVISAIQDSHPDDIEALIQFLLAGQCDLARADGLPWISDGEGGGQMVIQIADDPELAGKMIDENVPDVWTLLGIMRAAITLNFLPTSPAEPDDATAGGKAKGKATRRRKKKGT